MTTLRCCIDEPRLDWGLSRSYYGGDLSKPASYTVYPILWDAKRHGTDWFRENGEEVVGIFACSKHLYPGYADAFVVHEMNFEHSEVCDRPDPLTDNGAICLACQQLNNPIDFGESLSEWQSVQEYVSYDMGIFYFYNALFLKAQGDRYSLTFTDTLRGFHEAFDSVEKIALADFREEDERVEVSVPQREFEVAFNVICESFSIVRKSVTRFGILFVAALLMSIVLLTY